jgi:predicted LPLAT superfamily acyltransferase
MHEQRMTGQWRGRRERGSISAIRLIIWLALHAGRGVCRALLVPISAYFFVTAPNTRRSSQQFLSRALERPANWRDTFMHLLVFATTLLDRVYLLNDRHRELVIEVNNEATFWNALKLGRGCLLLGSHLGSFEMLGVVGSVQKKLTINMVMHVDDSAQLGRVITSAHVSLPYKIIALGQPGSMLQVKECLDRGEVVGILADRIYADEATESVSFLGSPARFSLSPQRLARVTGAPVVAVYGLFRGGRRYEIVFESLTTRAEAVRADTDTTIAAADAADAGALQSSLNAYVESLERQARRCPYNWFNFYDYWGA